MSSRYLAYSVIYRMIYLHVGRNHQNRVKQKSVICRNRFIKTIATLLIFSRYGCKINLNMCQA